MWRWNWKTHSRAGTTRFQSNTTLRGRLYAMHTRSSRVCGTISLVFDVFAQCDVQKPFHHALVVCELTTLLFASHVTHRFSEFIHDLVKTQLPVSELSGTLTLGMVCVHALLLGLFFLCFQHIASNPTTKLSQSVASRTQRQYSRNNRQLCMHVSNAMPLCRV